MRHFLLGSIVMLAGAMPAAAQSKFAAIHGASTTKYQEWINDLDKQNLRPTFVSVAVVKGEPMFAAIAVENEGKKPWQARHHLSAEKYQQEFNALRDKGLRPISVSGYPRGNAANYAAVFVKDDVEAWQARSGQTTKQSQETFNELVKDGFRPAQIVGYPVGDGVQFASLYVKNDERSWTARTHITAEQYQKLFDDFANKNAIPASVCAYPTKDGTRFGIVFIENKEKRTWGAKHHLTSKQYQEYFDEMTQKGFRPTHIYAYPWEGDTRYVAVFVKDS